MSEISREKAIEILCSETVGLGDIYDDAYEKAISDMEKLEKIEQIFEIKSFGEYPSTYEDMCREVIKIVRE